MRRRGTQARLPLLGNRAVTVPGAAVARLRNRHRPPSARDRPVDSEPHRSGGRGRGAFVHGDASGRGGASDEGRGRRESRRQRLRWAASPVKRQIVRSCSRRGRRRNCRSHDGQRERKSFLRERKKTVSSIFVVYACLSPAVCGLVVYLTKIIKSSDDSKRK